MIKNLRNQQILAKNLNMTKEVKNQIMHSEKYLLNLEETSEENSD